MSIRRDSDLLNALVRLAFQKSSLRGVILPLVKNATHMSEDARELELFITQDAQLYRSQHQPIIQNLLRKRKSGRYDFMLSIKLFMYLVDAGAKKYVQETGSQIKWNDLFPKSVRLEVAKSLAESFQAEADLGNYND